MEQIVGVSSLSARKTAERTVEDLPEIIRSQTPAQEAGCLERTEKKLTHMMKPNTSKRSILNPAGALTTIEYEPGLLMDFPHYWTD